jgi:hypothetical protein
MSGARHLVFAALARHLHEAHAGWQVVPSLWIDGGIFLHRGARIRHARRHLPRSRRRAANARRVRRDITRRHVLNRWA